VIVVVAVPARRCPSGAPATESSFVVPGTALREHAVRVGLGVAAGRAEAAGILSIIK